jgi:hypothetical protein
MTATCAFALQVGCSVDAFGRLIQGRGFRWPVAVTAATDCEDRIPEKVSEAGCIEPHLIVGTINGHPTEAWNWWAKVARSDARRIRCFAVPGRAPTTFTSLEERQ